MKAEEKTLLQGFLSKTLNLPETEFAAIFNAEGDLISVDSLIESDRLRIEAIRSQNETARKDQYSRGKKEALTDLEKSLRTKYAVESDKTGVELIEEIISKIAPTRGGTKLTDEEILKHPKFVEALHKYEKEINDLKTTHAGEIETLNSKFAKEKTNARVRLAVENIIETLKPILPQDPAKARKWKDTFIADVLAGEFSITDDGLIYPSEDGKPKLDAHGHSIKFDAMVRERANQYFEFPASQQRSGSGANEQSPPAGGNGNLNINSYAEYLEAMKTADTPEKRMALKPYYEKFKNQS